MLGREDLVLCAGTLLPTGLAARRGRPRATPATRACRCGWPTSSGRARRGDARRRHPRAPRRPRARDRGARLPDVVAARLGAAGRRAVRSRRSHARVRRGVLRHRRFDRRSLGEHRGDLGHPVTLDAAVEAFALVCDRAAEHGLLVHLEFLPWSAFPNVNAAWDVVRTADRPNGGLIIDSWHCAPQRDHDRGHRRDPGRPRASRCSSATRSRSRCPTSPTRHARAAAPR